MLKREDPEINEEHLINEVNASIDREIKRLEKLREEKSKILAKIRVVVRACLLVARADGEKFEEIAKINKDIFNRYFITGKFIRKYITSIKDVSLSSVKEDIEKYDIDKEFLKGLYDELCTLTYVDGDVSREEDKMLSKLFDIFKISLCR